MTTGHFALRRCDYSRQLSFRQSDLVILSIVSITLLDAILGLEWVESNRDFENCKAI